MDLKKLETDWAEDPQLMPCAYDNAEDLAEHLRKVHEAAMSGRLGPLGYLYRQQTLRLRKLLQEKAEYERKR